MSSLEQVRATETMSCNQEQAQATDTMSGNPNSSLPTVTDVEPAGGPLPNMQTPPSPDKLEGEQSLGSLKQDRNVNRTRKQDVDYRNAVRWVVGEFTRAFSRVSCVLCCVI